MCAVLCLFNILVRNASPRGPMHFRCLIFSLSGPCELLSLLCCFLDLRSVECNVVSLYVLCWPVNGSVCFVFGSVCELFGETIRNMFGGVCYFVVECDGVVECGLRCSIG